MRLKKHCLLITITIIITLFANLFPCHASGQVEPIAEVEEKLQGISDIEDAIMADLFTHSQEIEEMERQQEIVLAEIVQLQTDTEEIANEIKLKQDNYNSQLNVLEKVLVSYQRKGPVSFIETVLKSESLSEFIQGLNIIREISKNTGQLLSEIENTKQKLTLEKEFLLNKEQELDEYVNQLQTTIDDMYALKQDQEAMLDSLGEAKEIYEGELQLLQKLWDEIKVMFSDVIVNFTNIVLSGEFPIEALNLSISFPRLSGAIYHETINDIIKVQPELPDMVFTFTPEGILLDVPQKQLSLRGVFSIIDKSILKLEVKEGTFFNMPLTESSIDELFRNGAIVINFNELLGDVILESVEVFDGYLEFVIAPNFS